MVTTLLTGLLERVFDSKPRHTIIIGGDGKFRLLATEIALAGRPVSFIDSDPDARRAAGAVSQLSVFCADPTDRYVLERAGARFSRFLLAGTRDDDLNLRICEIAREAFGIPGLIACAGSLPGSTADIEVLDWPSAATRVLDGIDPPPRLLRVLRMDDAGEYVTDIEVLSPAFIGHELPNSSLEGCEVLALRRNHALIEVDDTTRLQVGDVLTLVGTAKGIDRAHSFVNHAC